MAVSAMAEPSAQASDAIAEYKALLRRYIDRRPSGTRQKLAEAFGTHKSFISQITNPTYRVPLPAQHIPALFRVCHLNAEEQRAFSTSMRGRIRANSARSRSLPRSRMACSAFRFRNSPIPNGGGRSSNSFVILPRR